MLYLNMIFFVYHLATVLFYWCSKSRLSSLKTIVMIFPESVKTTWTGYLSAGFLGNTWPKYVSFTFNLSYSGKLSVPIYSMNIHSVSQCKFPVAVSSLCKRNCILLIYYKTNVPANICWSWRRLQHVFSVTILRLPRRLEDILQDVLKTSWKTKNCYAEDVLKTCLEDVLKTLLEDFLKACLEDVLKTYLEDVLKTLWKQTKYSQGISVSNKSKCLSNKSIFQKSISDSSKVNPKCIN